MGKLIFREGKDDQKDDEIGGEGGTCSFFLSSRDLI
jgi:hypothetical protein